MGCFNPRTSCEVRRLTDEPKSLMKVSIHAPHARCDTQKRKKENEHLRFNPRTSCEVRPSCRCHSPHPTGFNPRTSCEVRRRLRVVCNRRRVSIHAPHARCDQRRSKLKRNSTGFQSTHLMRGATHSSSALAIRSRFQSTHLMRGATK